jgi:hypothetical protein
VKDNWSVRNIPISDIAQEMRKYKIVTEPDPRTGDIRIITEMMGKIEEEIIQTKSDQIRNALIDLGWTPPEGPE